MKKRQVKRPLAKLAVVLCAFLLLGSVPFTAFADVAETEPTVEEQAAEMLEKDRASGELLVRFEGSVSTEDALAILRAETDSAAVIEQVTAKTAEYPEFPESFLVTTADEKLFDLLVSLNSHSNVITAIPNYIHAVEDVVPSENVQPSQMQALQQTFGTTSSGDETEASYDPATQWALDMIGVQSAWDKTFSGSAEIKIGVLDTGLDTDHPEFDNNIDWTLAYNAVTQTTGAANVEDTHGHGTSVTGVIAADLDGTGMSGLCANVTVVPIKIGNGSFDQTVVDDAIEYACNKGIKILNISYVIYEYEYEYLKPVLQSFDGILVVSAGNAGIDMEDHDGASGKTHDDPNWIVVGASTSSDTRWSDSNFSAKYCDLFAPGGGIYTTSVGGGYTTSSGTSLAAPHVAAAIALIASKATHYSLLEIKELLLDTAVQSASFAGLCVSGGRLSIINAVNAVYGENRGAYTLGDIDGNGYITSNDYELAKKIYFGTYTPTEVQRTAMDVNRDGETDSLDYLMIKRYVFGTYYFTPA